MRPDLTSILLLSLAAAGASVAPGSARAQDAVDCSRVQSDAVATICATPRLVELQNLAAAEYRSLAGRIGAESARPIAREQLALRDACGPDAACIESRLVAAMGVFMATTAAPPLDPLVVSPFDPMAAPFDPSTPVGPAPDYPVGPDGVLILPVVPTAPSGFVGDLSPEERLAFGPPVELPGSAQFLRPPPPLEGVFKSLPEPTRRDVQVRLALAGLGGEPDGVWGPVTEDALRTAASRAAAQGRSFDLQSEAGAEAFLAYVTSADFSAEALGGVTVAPEADPVPEALNAPAAAGDL